MNAVSVCDVLISQRILLPLSALAAILTYIPDCPQLVPSVKLGFMFIWPSRERALRWPMVGITKKAIIFCHLNSHTAFFFLFFLCIACSNLLISALYRHGGDEAECMLILSQPLCYTTTATVVIPVTIVSGYPYLRTCCHRGAIISFATTVLVGDEITCFHNTLLM